VTNTISGGCRETVNPPVSGSLLTFEDESEPRAVAWRAQHPEPRPVPPIVVRAQVLLLRGLPRIRMLSCSYRTLCIRLSGMCPVRQDIASADEALMQKVYVVSYFDSVMPGSLNALLRWCHLWSGRRWDRH